MLHDPIISFLLPAYVKVQALALESLTSPPQIISQGYDLRFRSYIALKDVYIGFFFELGGGSPGL